jgi:multiple sugar transport system permease protein
MRREVEGYLFIAPWLVGFFAFLALPMVGSLGLAFTRYDVFTAPRWTGLANVRELLTDDLIRTALVNTLAFTAIAVPGQLIFALVLALALSLKVRGIGVYRTIFYMPTITPAVAGAFLWLWLFDNNYGLVNYALYSIGVRNPPGWFVDPVQVKPTIALISLWYVGNQMVIFLAALQGVPQTLYEAAEIDGATAWQRFRSVTLPMISPAAFFNLIITVIASFQVFTIAFLATGGGPANASLFYVLYLYGKGFQSFEMGYASLLAWVLFAIVLALTAIQFVVARRWVYYEATTAG